MELELAVAAVSIILNMVGCTAIMCSHLKEIKRLLKKQTELLDRLVSDAEGGKSRARFDDALFEAVADELERSLLRPPSSNAEKPSACSFVPVEVIRTNVAPENSNTGSGKGR